MANYFVALRKLTGETPGDVERNMREFKELHEEASQKLADNWRVVATHIYTSTDGHTWFYLWMVKLPT